MSVIIPTLNAGETLQRTLLSLRPAALAGLVREVVIADGGSSDRTLDMAAEAGARLVQSARGRGVQLATGANAARGGWLLFLHADTTLDKGWVEEVSGIVDADEDHVAVFRLRFDEEGLAPSLVAAGAMIRTRLFLSPYGDQGLLLPRRLYEAIGGYRPMPLFEDVDIIDRLLKHGGRRSLFVMKSAAKTSADRYRRSGYAKRVVKNSLCLFLYRLGVPPSKIAAFY